MIRKLFFAFLLIIGFQFVYSQTTHYWYQDGVVVFQFTPEKAPKLPMKDHQDVDFEKSMFLSHIINDYNITRVYYLHPEIKDIELRNTLQINFDNYDKVDDLIQLLLRFPFVQYAEKKELHRHFFTPNDTYFNTNYQWSLFKINAEQAWDISQGSSSVVVAVTDNAIWTSHPDLTNKLVAGYDVANNNNNPNPAGGNNGAHGTHVSGTVGAQTNNSLGVASIGYNVSVMPVKIGRDSDGALTAGYEGIIWAADNGADVINMSWGGSGASTYGQNVCNYAWNQGSILVAAAGNDNVSSMLYPAAYNNVIAVASTAQNDAKSSFSQFGAWINISAPGTQIASTVPTSYASSGYSYMSGTSMASPHVAGLLGLMKSANPSMSNVDLINCLYSSADNISAQNPGYPNQLGNGRINAYAALQCVTATVSQIDAGIEQIIQPTGASCTPSFQPIVVLKNYGSVPLTSVTINYQIVGGSLSTQSWTGNLASGASVQVQLPIMTSPTGLQVFRAFTTNPNGGQDQNPFNDEKTMNYGVFTVGISIPFTEDFESNSFATNMWTVQNPDNATTWQIYTTQGSSPGDKAAGINLFNYSTTGQRDAIISPPLSFAGFSSVELTFEHAYRRKNTTVSDSLIIYVSTDCGISYNRIFARGEAGTGTFATVQTSTTNFIPAVDTDWCFAGTVGSSCYSINLDSLAGQSNVIVKFESYNNNGNNLYIDNINISGNVVAYDIGVTQIIEPPAQVCGGNVIPKIVLRNFGSTTITSAQIHYQLNGGTVQNYSWTGNLSSGNNDTILLPQISPQVGQNTLYVYSSMPNGNTDANPSNDGTMVEFHVVSQGAPLPFTEDFETGDFDTNNWTIEDPDMVTTWAIYDIQGTTPGSKAAGVNFFFYSQTGERDGMISKPLNFSNQNTVWLEFEHAYRRYNQNSSDSLIIYVSTDCGHTYTRVFQAGESGTGTFATVATSTTNFIPAQASDWCHTGTVGASCFSVNLSQWAGQPLVQVKFESYNNYGNNLYIDNINIYGDVQTNEQNFYIDNETIILYPNPSFEGVVTIGFPQELQATTNIGIVNILGVKVYESQANVGDRKHLVDVSGFAKGSYIVYLQGDDGVHALKLVIQ
jgi:subtilisin family serine protease